MNQTPARLKSSSFLNHDPTIGISHASSDVSMLAPRLAQELELTN